MIIPRITPAPEKAFQITTWNYHIYDTYHLEVSFFSSQRYLSIIFSLYYFIPIELIKTEKYDNVQFLQSSCSDGDVYTLLIVIHNWQLE